MRVNKYIILLILSFSVISLKSQETYDSLKFINYEQNIIENSKYLINSDLYKKTQQESSPINIVHIGDSHLQAGFLTEKIKQNLLQHLKEISSSPGFIFPYAIAETNNPFFYKVGFSGNWTYCKNVDQEKTCELGLSGITLQTKDSIATIKIVLQNSRPDQHVSYYFDKLKILHNNTNKPDIFVNGIKALVNGEYSEVQFINETDSAIIEIKQQAGAVFNFYGIIPQKANSKLNYHTIGVNGATAQSYLKCDYFSKHLKILNPDIVILSLGTNEAYADNYNQIEHEYVFRDLILQIKDATNAKIICVSANDHLKERSYHNKNISLVNSNIKKIYLEQNIAFWDFYTIMGGKNSILEWYNKGLTGEDKLHFKKSGYQLQGDLFVDALKNILKNKKN